MANRFLGGASVKPRSTTSSKFNRFLGQSAKIKKKVEELGFSERPDTRPRAAFPGQPKSPFLRKAKEPEPKAQLHPQQLFRDIARRPGAGQAFRESLDIRESRQILPPEGLKRTPTVLESVDKIVSDPKLGLKVNKAIGKFLAAIPGFASRATQAGFLEVGERMGVFRKGVEIKQEDKTVVQRFFEGDEPIRSFSSQHGKWKEDLKNMGMQEGSADNLAYGVVGLGLITDVTGLGPGKKVARELIEKEVKTLLKKKFGSTISKDVMNVIKNDVELIAKASKTKRPELIARTVKNISRELTEAKQISKVDNRFLGAGIAKTNRFLGQVADDGKLAKQIDEGIKIEKTVTNQQIKRQKKIAEKLSTPQKLDYIKHKKATREVFGDFKKSFDKAATGFKKLDAGMKSDARAIEKAVDDNKDIFGRVDFTKIKDMNRAAMIIDDFSDVSKMIKNVENNFEIIKIKNRLSSPAGMNYRDILINVKMANGTIAEIQLIPKEMAKAKDVTHKFYETTRAIEGIKNNRGLRRKEVNKYLIAKKTQLDNYTKAWKEDAKIFAKKQEEIEKAIKAIKTPEEIKVLSKQAQLEFLEAAIKREGGATINLNKFQAAPSKGYSVSIYPEASKQIPLEKFNTYALAKYIRKNKALLADSRNNFGPWIDDGQVYLDVSRVISDERLARDLGKKYNQISIYDMAKGAEIKTGGTGKVVKGIDDISKRASRIDSEIAKVEKAEIQKAVSKAKKISKPQPKAEVKKTIRETTGQAREGTELTKLGERLQAEAKGARKGKTVGRELAEKKAKEYKEGRELLASIKKGIVKEFEKEKNIIRKKIGFQRAMKSLDDSIMRRLKKVAGVEEWKNATKIQLEKVLKLSKEVTPGDKFLTDNQIKGLKNYVKTFDKDPLLITQKEIAERFKVQRDLSSDFLSKWTPTVDIKENNQVIRKIVDNADFELRLSTGRVKKIRDDLEVLLSKAEKTSGKKKTLLGNRRRYVGNRIFKAMGGEKLNLTSEEKEVVVYLKDYFAKVKEDLGLKSYRKNYITHTEKTFYEKLVENNFNITKAVDSLRAKKSGEIPIDVMLNLDEIVGSEKFFRFALKRSGKIDPSTNIRRILSQYAGIAEEKKALDRILPEGQAAIQLLLESKSAQWMKRFLQNLKGRGLDANFKMNNPGMNKAVNTIIDFGYLRLLALNKYSWIKNIIGGEANSFVFQPFSKYMQGKARLLGRPKLAYKRISESGLLDGSYVDVLDRTFEGRAKKAMNLAFYGTMQAAEYEIRGSMFLGELTKLEWRTGNIGRERFRQILDKVAITQGIYNKIDTPLGAQTALGRSVLQFSRWKITNANLFKRIIVKSKKEWKAGEFTGEGTRQLLKTAMVFSMGTYLAYQAAQAGNKQAEKIAKSGTELVNVVLNLPQEVYNAVTDNPLLSTADSFLYSLGQMTSWLGITEEPRKLEFRTGIDRLYFSALKTFGINGGTFAPKKEDKPGVRKPRSSSGRKPKTR